MKWKDKRECGPTQEFTEAQLLEICPQQLTRHVRFLAHGTEVPTEDDEPIHWRASGLEFFKKAVLLFVPNRNVQWLA